MKPVSRLSHTPLTGFFLFRETNTKIIMKVFSANDWADNYKPNKFINFESRKVHNEKMQDSAEFHAESMRKNPSYLEKLMIEFLNSHSIQHEFQKIFYLYDKDKRIVQYFIADFYIPSKKLIIETDGKYHDSQKKYDLNRTKLLQKNYKVNVARFTLQDFKAPSMENLLLKINSSSYYNMKKKIRENRRKSKTKTSNVTHL